MGSYIGLAILLNATGRLAEAVVLLRERAAKSEVCLAAIRKFIQRL